MDLITDAQKLIKQAQALIKRVAEPRPVGDSVKAAILRADRRLGWRNPARVKNIWYADRRVSLTVAEWERLKEVAGEITITSDSGDHHAELRQLRAQMHKLEERLSALDHQPAHMRWEGNHAHPLFVGRDNSR